MLLLFFWRRSSWAWQQGQLFGGDQWWHGCGHRFLGQLPQDMELTSLGGTSGSHSFWSQSHCSAPLPHRTPPSSSPPYRCPGFLLSALSHYPTVSQRGEDQQWRASTGSLCLSGFTSRLERWNRLCCVCIYPPFFMLVCITYALLTVFGCSGLWILVMGVLAVPVFFSCVFFLVSNHSAICHTQWPM